jgi:hypothetical protein
MGEAEVRNLKGREVWAWDNHGGKRVLRRARVEGLSFSRVFLRPTTGDQHAFSGPFSIIESVA